MQQRTRAELVLLSCTLIWGSTFVVTKQGLGDASPFAFLAVRFVLASLLLLSVRWPSIRRLDRRAALRGGLLGVFLFAGFATQTVGLQYTTASKSGFITGLLVVLTPLLQIVVTRKRLAAGNVIGVVLVTGGLYLLTSPSGAGFNLGDALTVACALAFALYIVYVDVFGRASNPSQLTFMQVAVTALLSCVAMAFEEVRIVPTATLFGSVGYLAVFATVIALGLQTHYQRDTTPTRAAVLFSLEPVFAALLGYLALDERLGALGVLGGAIIVLGVLFSQLGEARLGRGHAPPP